MAEATETREQHRQEHTGEQAHPSVADYVRIAIVLAIVTMAEVAMFYLDFVPDPIVVATLLVLAAIKFGLVVLWFMHLKFDSPTFMRLFATGLALAVTIFVVVLLTFGIFL